MEAKCWICGRTEKEIQNELRRLHKLYNKSSIPPYDHGSIQENRLVFFDPPEKIHGFLMKFRLWNDKYEEGEYKIGIGMCDICASLLENISTLACDKFLSDNIEPSEYTRRVTGIQIENPEGENLMVLDGNTLLCRWCGKKDFRKGSTYSMHNYTFQSIECIACGRKRKHRPFPDPRAHLLQRSCKEHA